VHSQGQKEFYGENLHSFTRKAFRSAEKSHHCAQGGTEYIMNRGGPGPKEKFATEALCWTKKNKGEALVTF